MKPTWAIGFALIQKFRTSKAGNSPVLQEESLIWDKVGLAGGRPMKLGKGFSTRLMFIGGRRFSSYFYWMDNPRAPSNDPNNLGKIYGNGAYANYTWVPGQWYFIEQHVKLNSPGAATGLMEVWINGTKFSTIANTRIRGLGQNFKITDIHMDTYLGGNTSSWYSPIDTYVVFDTFVVSRNRIGGAGRGAGVPPDSFPSTKNAPTPPPPPAGPHVELTISPQCFNN